MKEPCKSIAGISKRFHFASLHYIFSAYLPTHIKFLTEFHRIIFGTTCKSFPFFTSPSPIITPTAMPQYRIHNGSVGNPWGKLKLKVG